MPGYAQNFLSIVGPELRARREEQNALARMRYEQAFQNQLRSQQEQWRREDVANQRQYQQQQLLTGKLPENYRLTPQGTAERIPGLPPAPPARPAFMESEAYKSGLKQLEKDDADVNRAKNIATAYGEWADLNARVDTGPILGRRPISFSPDYQRLKQLESFLAVNNFKPGQGQISNFERELIKGAGPSTLNDRTTNEAIVKIGLGAAQNAADRANFREWWLQNKGNLFGADRAWQNYLDANPRYTKDQSGTIVDNGARRGWEDVFGAGPGTQPAPMRNITVNW